MDEHPKHQEPIRQATAQFPEGQLTETLNQTLKNCLLILYQKTDSIKELCRPMEMGGNGSWKLGVQESEDSEIEEVLLRIQGVVCNRELPPIRFPFKMYVWMPSPSNNILIP
jgi:hypothetical protein